MNIIRNLRTSTKISFLVLAIALIATFIVINSKSTANIDETAPSTSQEIESNVAEKTKPNPQEVTYYTTHLAGPYHRITSEFDSIWENYWEPVHAEVIRKENVFYFINLQGVSSKFDKIIEELDTIEIDGLTEESKGLIQTFQTNMKEAIKYRKRVISQAWDMRLDNPVNEDDYIYILDTIDKSNSAYLEAKQAFQQFKIKNGIE